MIKIVTKEKQDLVFDDEVKKILFFVNYKIPIVIQLDLNLVEFISGGILEIDKQVYSFDHIYLNVKNGKADIMAENLVKIEQKPKLESSNKVIKNYQNQLKLYEDALSENSENLDLHLSILNLQKNIALLFYLKWKGNIWK